VQADVDVIEYLVENVTECRLVVGTSAFYGPLRPPQRGVVDELAVFCIPFSGPAPESFHSCTTSRYEANLQLWFRGRRNRYDEVKDLAREALQLLQSDGDPVISGYVDVQTLESEPLYQGEDGDGRPQFTLNVVLEKFE
jgi:hypothetical protein